MSMNPPSPLVGVQTPSTDYPGFFRFRQVGDRYVITNVAGDFLLLDADELARVAAGDVPADSTLHRRLAERGFVRAEVDVPGLAARLRERKRFLHYGPNLHILVVTLRCNQTCVYCHASRRTMDAVETDMTRETAEKAVDAVLSTTNPSVTIEFQGGEPLASFDVVRHVVDYALERNQRAGKELGFALVSNLSLMDEGKLSWLLEHRVQVCTSVDGPAALHDRQRTLPGGSAFERASHWIRRINAEYAERGLDPTLYHVEALLTTTRNSLGMWKEIVDAYVDLGCRALFLRPLDPFGFVDRSGPRISVEPREFLAFYRQAVDYMLELNAKGVEVLERFAAIFLTKILCGTDPDYLDIRSPCGAGIGQVAYNYDGRVFTCDEGRMLAEQGDDAFCIGHLDSDSYRQLVGHPMVRAAAIASNLDGQPDCSACAYNPYCGVCPAHNRKTQGTVFGRMRESALCAVHMGIQDYLFEKISLDDERTMRTFRQWTTARARTHFLHDVAAARAP